MDVLAANPCHSVKYASGPAVLSYESDIKTNKLKPWTGLRRRKCESICFNDVYLGKDAEWGMNKKAFLRKVKRHLSPNDKILGQSLLQANNENGQKQTL